VVLVGVVAGIWLAAREPPSPGLPLPEGPSLAVLPLQNLSGKSEDEWFSDGLTETLITDLSRLNGLFVIARNSSFVYKGRPVDIRQVGRELGVRYVLEGSVQRTEERLRLSAQLIEASTGRHLWAERYDRKLDDLFEVQDDLTQQVVTALDVTLLQGEQARTWRKTTRNRRAYELYLQGSVPFLRMTREDNRSARALFQQALDLDPEFAMAMVMLGNTHHLEGISGWSSDYRGENLQAVELTQRAISIDPSLAHAYAFLGNVLLALERHAEAVSAIERALALGPGQADTLALSAWAFSSNGRAEEAVALAEHAFRLNPFPPATYLGALGDSLLFARRIEEALPVQRKCVDQLPDFLWCRIGLTLTYVEAGKLEDARREAAEAMRIHPKLLAADDAYVRSIGDPRERAHAVESLRRAGLR
jgi:adenylate cyclase